MNDDDCVSAVRRSFIYFQYQIKRWRQQSLYVYLTIAGCVFFMILLIINSPMMHAARHSRYNKKLPGLHLRPPSAKSNSQPSRVVSPIKHLLRRLDREDPCAPMGAGGERDQYQRFLERDLQLHIDGKHTPDAEDFIKLLPHDTDQLHADHEHTGNALISERRDALTYNVAYVPTKSHQSVLLRVSERYRGNLTDGGSGFHASLRGRHSELMCPVKDHFNGDYMVCCPIVEDNSVVEIIQTYVDFAAFSGAPMQPRVLPIFKANIRKK